MKHCIRAAVVAMLVLCSYGAAPWTAIAQGNVNGNVYTSPTYGYQIQWSDPWFFYEEGTEAGADAVVISNGTSDASFIFAFAPGTTLQDLIDASIVNPAPEVSNIQPMLDAQGAPVRGFNGDQEWAVYTADQLLPDGTAIQIMQYFNLRSLDAGVILAMYGVTVSFFWDDSSVQTWNDLADSALVGAAPGPPITTDVSPTAAAPTAPTPPAAPTAPSAPTETPLTLKPTTIPATAGAGEPAPVFAAGPWRIAARAVDLGESIDYLGLGAVAGNQWVVVYADVNNWSDAEAQLDSASWQLATTSGSTAPDVAGTQSTATQLGLEPSNGSSVTVPAGGSVRLALVYSIPTSETELILQIGDAQLPLENAVGTQFDVTDLSTIAEPPTLIEGTMSVISIGGTGAEFFVETSAGAPLISLAGVEIPTDLACFDSGSALLVVNDHLGQRLWLEADPAITEPDTYYVWYEDAQGNRMLLNQQVIAEGAALEGDLPEAARFGAWLEQTEAVAEANGVGQWSTCAGQI